MIESSRMNVFEICFVFIFSYLCLEMLIQSPIYMGLCLFRGEV